MTHRDLIHSTYCDLYSLAEIMAAFASASEPAPLDLLAAWVKRLAVSLDTARWEGGMS